MGRLNRETQLYCTYCKNRKKTEHLVHNYTCNKSENLYIIYK